MIDYFTKLWDLISTSISLMASITVFFFRVVVNAFALTMVFSLFASLLVAISVVPVLAHTLFKGYLYDKNKKIKEHKQKDSGVYRKACSSLSVISVSRQPSVCLCGAARQCHG